MFAPKNMRNEKFRPALVTRTRDGMTLIEVVLAIAVAGFVLVSATSFLVSVSSIWAEREDRHFFEDHVDGVTEFLKACFSNAGMEIKLENDEGDGGSQSSSSLIGTIGDAVAWARPPGFRDYEDPLLNFTLANTPPLLIGESDLPPLGVNIFLQFDKEEGLSLVWYSKLQEEVEDERDLRRTEISPLVTKLSYIYWDENIEKWEEEDKPMEGEGDEQFLLPRFIKIFFEKDGIQKERTLALPLSSKSALIF